jgi:hypothetical protein
MDRQTVKTLRDRIQKVLDDAKIEGFSVKVGNATFGETSAVFKVGVATIGDNGVVQDRKSENFKQLAGLYGLKLEDLGKSFDWGHKSYTIIGLNPKSRRFPILAKRNDDGKVFKFPETVAKSYPTEMSPDLI